jgi:tetratricopeptide (TPR) repeat protein
MYYYSPKSGLVKRLIGMMKTLLFVVLLNLISGCANTLPKKATVEVDCWDYLLKAIVFREASEYQNALEYIDTYRVCEKHDVGMPYYYHKGWTYLEMGEAEESIKEFSKGIIHQPTYIFAYWRRGLAHESMGNLESAKLDFRTAYEVGKKEFGDKFPEVMEKNPKVAAKLLQQ